MPKVESLMHKTYLKVIENSVGTSMFRTYFATIDGVEQDIMQNGTLSCAFFASSVLTMFAFIKRIHGTVDGTIADLEASGWVKTEKPKHGDVVIWEPVVDESGRHKHIGFYIDTDTAISNNSFTGVPARHDLYFRKGEHKRAVEVFYTNQKLFTESR